MIWTQDFLRCCLHLPNAKYTLLDLTRSNESYTSIIFGTPDGQFSDEVLQIEALSKTLT